MPELSTHHVRRENPEQPDAWWHTDGHIVVGSYGGHQVCVIDTERRVVQMHKDILTAGYEWGDEFYQEPRPRPEDCQPGNGLPHALGYACPLYHIGNDTFAPTDCADCTSAHKDTPPNCAACPVTVPGVPTPDRDAQRVIHLARLKAADWQAEWVQQTAIFAAGVAFALAVAGIAHACGWLSVVAGV